MFYSGHMKGRHGTCQNGVKFKFMMKTSLIVMALAVYLTTGMFLERTKRISSAVKWVVGHWWFGGFSELGTSNLAILSGKQNSTKFIATLEKYLLPFAEEMHSNGRQFQQDNASIDTSRLKDSWFTAKHINVMSWSVQTRTLTPFRTFLGCSRGQCTEVVVSFEQWMSWELLC